MAEPKKARDVATKTSLGVVGGVVVGWGDGGVVQISCRIKGLGRQKNYILYLDLQDLLKRTRHPYL